METIKDSQDRILQEVVGGVTYTYTYEGDNVLPSTEVDSKGNSYQWTYIDRLITVKEYGEETDSEIEVQKTIHLLVKEEGSDGIQYTTYDDQNRVVKFENQDGFGWTKSYNEDGTYETTYLKGGAVPVIPTGKPKKKRTI